MSQDLTVHTPGLPATTQDYYPTPATGHTVSQRPGGGMPHVSTTQRPRTEWSDEQHYAAFGGALTEHLTAAGIRDGAVVQRIVTTARAALTEGNELETPFHALAPFAARLAQAGESAGAIRAAVNAAASYLSSWFGPTDDREHDDLQDRDETARTMRAEWGYQYAINRRLCIQYLDSLPPVVQVALENARLDDGTLALNAPNMLRWLVQQACGPARASAGSADEKAELEELMRDRNSRYWKGPQAAQLQARYRDLVGATSERPLPSGSAVDREIAEIEHVMRVNRSRYNRDERMQARYRALLQKRGQP